MNKIFRPSSLEERKEFYDKEFSIKRLKKWFGRKKPQLIAIDAGSETNIVKNKKWKNTLFYCYLNELGEKIKKYVPEDIYYDRNIYKNPLLRFKNLKHQNFLAAKNVLAQELVFDVDADNIKCRNHGAEQKVCNICLQKAWSETKNLVNDLKAKFNFRKIKIVYSGKGFHIHVLDKEAYFLSREERINICKQLKKYPIDSWVSEGSIELVRLPFSLNGEVSRIAIPIKLNKNLNLKETIPEFLSLY